MNRIDTLEPGFHLKVSELLTNVERVTGLTWGIVSAKRSLAEQHALFLQPHDGKDNDGDGKIDEADEKVTNADAGQSPHNFAMACDCCPMKDGNFWWEAPDRYWQMYGELAEGMGLVWGGDFKSISDKPHIEDPKWKIAQAKWRANGGKLA